MATITYVRAIKYVAEIAGQKSDAIIAKDGEQIVARPSKSSLFFSARFERIMRRQEAAFEGHIFRVL